MTHDDAKRVQLTLEMLPQPDDRTCGPTCLHAVYAFHGDGLPLEQVIREVRQLEDGGTLGVILGEHALRRGYDVSLHTYNLRVFDPTWFALPAEALCAKLEARYAVKREKRLRVAIEAYLTFLRMGGVLRFEDLTGGLLRRYLKRGVPILTGLSATYLYRCVREAPETEKDDDVGGEPVGHFVVLSGYERESRSVHVADPMADNPTEGHYYTQGIDHLICSILLGIMTYDANLLVIEPRKPRDA